MGLPNSQGLYDPANEHDACGVGMVAHIRGEKSHEIVEQALEILERIDHRGAVGADPLLGALAANGGAGQTHLPAAGSPLVDAGDLGCSATDQRGTSTPQGAFCDIGSVEVVGGAVATTTTTAAPVTTTTSGGVATTAPPASVAPTVAAGPNFTG